MFCSKCGKENLSTDKYCFNCGNPLNETTTPDGVKHNGKKTAITVAVVAIFLCFAIVLGIISIFTITFIVNKKSPENLLADNEWYSDVDVTCEYYDWSSIDGGKGYWITAYCSKSVFYSYGKVETTEYEIGGDGSVHGPFSYEIDSENIPSYIEWRKDIRDRTLSWRILKKNTLNVDEDEYYLWDDEKDTHCYCEDYECEHRNTWYVTKEYLRIGRVTYCSEKPECLNVDD